MTAEKKIFIRSNHCLIATCGIHFPGKFKVVFFDGNFSFSGDLDEKQWRILVLLLKQLENKRAIVDSKVVQQLLGKIFSISYPVSHCYSIDLSSRVKYKRDLDRLLIILSERKELTRYQQSNIKKYGFSDMEIVFPNLTSINLSKSVFWEFRALCFRFQNKLSKQHILKEVKAEGSSEERSKS